DETPQLQQAYAFVPSAGAVVVRVLESSPADTAGIEEGDVIVSFGGHVIGSATDLTTAVQAFKPGDHVKIALWRGRQLLTVTTTLGSMALG
ncbi:MAG TPA: PDZ domain-containing protein, partial [Acidimicrobiales bacterium]|nr:PDZ domain-containing protein [Acidimicrobiales bacterium]